LMKTNKQECSARTRRNHTRVQFKNKNNKCKYESNNKKSESRASARDQTCVIYVDELTGLTGDTLETQRAASRQVRVFNDHSTRGTGVRGRRGAAF